MRDVKTMQRKLPYRTLRLCRACWHALDALVEQWTENSLRPS